MWAIFKQTEMFDIQEDRKEYYENIVDKPLELIGGIWVRHVNYEEPKLSVHSLSLVILPLLQYLVWIKPGL